MTVKEGKVTLSKGKNDTTVSAKNKNQKPQKKGEVKAKFFQDSEDEAMDWSSDEEDEEDLEDSEEGDEEAVEYSEDESNDEDFDEEEFADSQEEFEVDEEEDAEFVEEDSDQFEEESAQDEESNDDDDGDEEVASESEGFALKEKDLLVPSIEAPASNPLLKFFWKLSDGDKSVRLAAVSDLINHLQISQSAYVATTASNDSWDASKEKVFSLYDSGALQTNCCADLTYTLKRLIKGLASGRDEARFGFMLALLAVYHAFSVQLSGHAEVLMYWSFKLNTPGAMGGSLKKREERLMYVARLFAMGALFRTPALVANLSEASLRLSIDSAVGLAKKKSFLRESALEVLLALFKCEGLPQGLAAYAFRRLGAQSALMCEAFAFAVSVEGSLESIEVTGTTGADGATTTDETVLPMPQFIQEFKRLDCLLFPQNSSPILDILAEVPTLEGRLHLLWKLVAKQVTFGAEPFLNKTAFMSTVIEGMLLNNAGSAISKRWTGFLLVRELIALDALEWMPIVFTPATARLIRGALGLLGRAEGSAAPGKEISAFNRAVKAFMSQLIEAAQSGETDSKQAMLLITTIGRIPSGLPGKSLLEACTEDASITDKLYAQLTLENVSGIISQLKAQISMTSSAAAFVAQFDKLAGLLKVDRLCKMTGAEEWIQSVLDGFISFLTVGDLPSEHSEALKAKLMSVLTELVDSRRTGVTAGNWIDRVSGAFEAKMTEVDAPTKDSLSHLTTCAKTSAGLKPERLARAHTQLCSFLKLMIFLDPIDAIPCCDELLAVSPQPQKKGKKQADTGAIVQVIIDTLLTFLAKPVQFTRRMCDEIFKSLVPVIQSATQFDALFAILKSGRVEDFMDVEEDEVNEEEGEDESEIEDESGLAALDAASASESEESDLNDEQMEVFDVKLAEIFREKKKLALTLGNSAKRYAKEKRDLTQMKGKVLELLNVAFRSGDLSLAVRLQSIEPLLSVVAANVSLAHNGSGKGKAASSAAQEHVKLVERIETFMTESLVRSTRPAGEEEAALACEVATRVMTAIAGGSLLKEQEVGVAVLMRAANSIWYCVRVVRSCKSSAEANEATLKTSFNVVVAAALAAAEEVNWRILRGFVMTWATSDLSFVLPGLAINAEALSCLIENPTGLRIFQRRQLLEMLISAIKRASSFGMKEPACTVLAALPAAFSSVYSGDLSALKVDFMREDWKFVQIAAKKHAELDNQNGNNVWEKALKTIPRAMEAHLIAKGDQSSGAKSFLGQLKH